MCLLKRARWFEEHLRFVDRGAASLVEESRLADSMAWQASTGKDSLAVECAGSICWPARWRFAHRSGRPQALPWQGSHHLPCK